MNITVSNATISYAMSGRASAICSGVQMSRLAISAKRPFGAVAFSVASMNPSLVQLLSTTSTPAPSVSARSGRRNPLSASRRRTSLPACASVARLKVLAVAKTVAPHCWAIWTAANPTPPLAAWMSTLSPGLSCAQSNDNRTVNAAAGMVAASTALTPSRDRREEWRGHVENGWRMRLHGAVDALTHFDSLRNPVTQLGDDAGEVAADRAGIAGIEAKDVEHVAKLRPAASTEPCT